MVAKARTTKKTVVPVDLNAPLDIATRDGEGRTPLHLAAMYGYTDTVRRMLTQEEAAVNIRDDKERTPGHWSAFKGHLPVVKLLVQHGADVNARDNGGRTMLRMAVIGQQGAVEEYLRAHGGEL